VRKSLVQLDERDGGAARYRLLDTVRQYGRERLAMTGAASRGRLSARQTLRVQNLPVAFAA